jgi:hypothetical protein
MGLTLNLHRATPHLGKSAGKTERAQISECFTHVPFPRFARRRTNFLVTPPVVQEVTSGVTLLEFPAKLLGKIV